MAVLGMSLISCGDDSPTGTDGPEAVSRIRGQVEATPGTVNAGGLRPLHLGNAAISVLSITGAGNPDTVSVGTTVSAGGGMYEVETSTEGQSHLIVLARAGTSEFQGVVAASTVEDTSVVAPPLTEETTLEALVYRSLRARGAVAPGVFADHQSWITSYVAEPADRIPQTVEILATALTEEAAVQKAAIDLLTSGTSAWNFINAARYTARVTLDIALDASSEMAVPTANAYKVYYAAEEAAFEAVGLSPARHAMLRAASGFALNRAAEPLPAAVKLGLLQTAAYRRSRLIERAVDIAFDSLGAAPARLSTLRSEAFNLHSSILTASSAGQIQAAFLQYHNRLVANLALELPGLAEDIQAADAAITADNGLLALRTAAATQCTSAACVAEAYRDFHDAIHALVVATVDPVTLEQLALLSTVLGLAAMVL